MVLLLLHRFALQNCDLHGIFVLRTLHYQIQSSFYPDVTSLRNHWVLLPFPHVTPQHLFISLFCFLCHMQRFHLSFFFYKKIFKKTITKSLKGRRLVQQNIPLTITNINQLNFNCFRKRKNKLEPRNTCAPL